MTLKVRILVGLNAAYCAVNAIAYSAGESARAAPHGLCDACNRRAAWLVVGGEPYCEADPVNPDEYMTTQPVRVCGGGL